MSSLMEESSLADMRLRTPARIASLVIVGHLALRKRDPKSLITRRVGSIARRENQGAR